MALADPLFQRVIPGCERVQIDYRGVRVDLVENFGREGEGLMQLGEDSGVVGFVAGFVIRIFGGGRGV